MMLDGVHRRRSVALLCLSLGPHEGHSHLLESVITPVKGTKGNPLAPEPHVLIFLHIAKCGGTTVRQMFKNTGWHMTLWSLSQRLVGWKANRLLHSIHSALAMNKSRIFVEWHLDMNFSFIPALEQYVKAMKPDVQIGAFTLFRDPSKLVASNGAFWRPFMPADLYIRLKPDELLKTILEDWMGGLYVPSNMSTACKSAHHDWTFCRRIEHYHASMRICGRSDPERILSRCRASTLSKFTHGTFGDGNVSDQDREAAAYDVATMEGWRLSRDATGCEVLIERALANLAPVHVLHLEDNPWPTLQAVALGINWNFSVFTQHVNESIMPRTVTAKTAEQYLVPYRTPESIRKANLENSCSSKMIGRLASSRDHHIEAL